MKRIYLIMANHGLYDEDFNFPVVAVFEQSQAEFICDDFSYNKESIYRQPVADAIEIGANLEEISLTIREIPFSDSTKTTPSIPGKPLSACVQEQECVFKEVSPIKQGSRICPKCGAIHFSAIAHVTQEWELNENGEFSECLQEHIDTTHTPDDDDIWTCLECGYSAEGREFTYGGKL